ncbi:fumarylacetoacetate hydrolase family protein [Collimonas pratensis]|uniref:Fumarylacetoacetate (FAA) hydrolase family protein n=1 Tax=Collimonas pratensis TaxID=279113 RepID=A0ABM5Z7L4_9BURK|nr:fumarylacetoacetate hydrolase family protein [Collimonas pratensis]AMP15024.1 fumarylacetoacetate (FAA) hydrolase family protein [Collimonas pratensis]
MIRHWLRFMHQDSLRFGTLEGKRIQLWEGSMFGKAQASGVYLDPGDVELLTPTAPSKVLALWNNFGALGAKLNLAPPPEPLYLIKAPNSYLNPQGIIRAPAAGGKVVFEGELGIVIGKTASQVAERDAGNHIFGYTCANDVTAAEILNRDPTFAQWVRAKGFDTFCPFGPVVASGIDPHGLRVKTWLNGELRQDYPVSDMLFSPARLVSLISQDMSLYPGDLILCGTSVGVGSMKPGSMVEIEIEGIGKLGNRFE